LKSELEHRFSFLFKSSCLSEPSLRYPPRILPSLSPLLQVSARFRSQWSRRRSFMTSSGLVPIQNSVFFTRNETNGAAHRLPRRPPRPS
jgi:hypothetical protein